MKIDYIFQIITFFILILFSLFVYIKSLNVSHLLNYKVIGGGIVFSGTLAYLIFFFIEPIPTVRYVLMVLFITVFAGKITRVKLSLALTTSLLSVGISAGVFSTSSFISISLLQLVLGITDTIFHIILSSIISGIVFFSFFRIKRYRKGFPFLHNRISSIIGIILSGVIISILVLIRHISFVETGIWFLSAIVICIIAIIFWCRSAISKLYRRRIKESTIKKLEKQIQSLKTDNEAMARVIHRDSKLLFALREAVLPVIENNPEAKIIFDRIEFLVQERAKFINSSHTNNLLIDSTLNHMMYKASEKGIKLGIKILCDTSRFDEIKISNLDMETLIADLVENAIIATCGSEYNQIKITFGKEDNFYTLTIEDSGVPFEVETLLNLGQKRASTHLHEGGSGIGYMAIFKILQSNKIGIIIREFMPRTNEFTKSITINFNGEHSYTIHTYRAEKFNALKKGNFPIVLEH